MSAIDWELIRKRMILMKYQPAYFASTTPPTSNWILALGVWNDGGDWIDAETWID